MNKLAFFSLNKSQNYQWHLALCVYLAGVCIAEHTHGCAKLIAAKNASGWQSKKAACIK